MGIFPIIMNTLQFWLIDSIVKASGTQFNPPYVMARSSDAQDREPLFRSSEDDGDNIPSYDVEGVSRPSGSRMSSGMNTIVCPQDDLSKLLSAPSSPIVFSGTISPTHDYPPNVGTPSSTTSSRSRQRIKRSPPSSLEFGSTRVPSPTSDFPQRLPPRRSPQENSGSQAAGNSTSQLITDLEKEAWTRHAGSEDRRGRRSEHNQYLIGEK